MPPLARQLNSRQYRSNAYYESEALREGWSVRQLDRQFGSQLLERLALSRNKAALLKKAADAQEGDVLTPEEAIRDPFVLEFLDLKDEYSDFDLEAALIHRFPLGNRRRLRICRSAAPPENR